jgi:hypothetical protein
LRIAPVSKEKADLVRGQYRGQSRILLRKSGGFRSKKSLRNRHSNFAVGRIATKSAISIMK